MFVCQMTTLVKDVATCILLASFTSCFLRKGPATSVLLTDFPRFIVCQGLADRAQGLNSVWMPDVFHKAALDSVGVCLLS